MTTAVAAPTGYAPLDAEGVPAYLAARPELRALVPGPDLHVREVGDGNLNLVFVVRDDPAHPGIVLKQSLPYVRVFGEAWPLTIERIRHEADAYAAWAPWATDGIIPTIHAFDGDRHVLAMEDLADARIWRGALNDGEIHDGAAAALGRFVAGIAFHTSDAGLDPAAKKQAVIQATNPELCRITEDLVLTEPYIEHERNWFADDLAGIVAELRADAALKSEVAGLKHRFLTRAEARIHGDLHTGSVMVGGGRTVAIDPEFAFYGPVGFDLGALWANAVLAAARAQVLARPADFQAHVAAIIPASWSAFDRELRRLWPDRLDASLDEGFLDAWLAQIHEDAVGFAGAKIIRRVIGYAHVSDIETLEPEPRHIAASAALAIGRRLVRERRSLPDPNAVGSVVTEGLP